MRPKVAMSIVAAALGLEGTVHQVDWSSFSSWASSSYADGPELLHKPESKEN